MAQSRGHSRSSSEDAITAFPDVSSLSLSSSNDSLASSSTGNGTTGLPPVTAAVQARIQAFAASRSSRSNSASSEAFRQQRLIGECDNSSPQSPIVDVGVASSSSSSTLSSPGTTENEGSFSVQSLQQKLRQQQQQSSQAYQRGGAISSNSPAPDSISGPQSSPSSPAPRPGSGPLSGARPSLAQRRGFGAADMGKLQSAPTVPTIHGEQMAFPDGKSHPGLRGRVSSNPSTAEIRNMMGRGGPGGNPLGSAGALPSSLSAARGPPVLSGGSAINSPRGGPNNLSRRRPQLNLPTINQGRTSMSTLPTAAAPNIFSNYQNYLNVKDGTLNFNGKASLSAQGIDFSSGSSFRISLDQLESLGELGAGNYGTVTKVLHKPTNVIMAMKEIRLELDETKFAQIIMELDTLHKCVAPQVVDFYGAFFTEGAVYVCMEYMDGGSLEKVYAGGVDELVLAAVADSVVRGLHELKEKHNVMHRDVRPTNILVNTAGKIKLCDFGVSGNLVSSIAKTNIGCQSYMAPERINMGTAKPSTYTVHSDIWSLGLTLIEVADGSYPYPPETYSNIFSQLEAIVNGDPPALSDRFSPEAQDFVEQCLNKVAAKRPSYSALLKHPFLEKFRTTKPEDAEKHVADFVAKALAKKGKDKSHSKPPLHNGGVLPIGED